MTRIDAPRVRFKLGHKALFLLLLCASCQCGQKTPPQPAQVAVQAPPPAAVKAAPEEPAPSDVAAPPADARQLPGGVAIKQLKTGDGTPPPADNDCIRASFASWKRDGALFSTSRGRAEPPLQCLGSIMPGLKTAVMTMSIGEQSRIWIPGNLTFRATEPNEPAPNDDLTFELTLLAILRAPARPTELDAPAKNAKKTPSGLAYVILKKGTGKANPKANERVRIRFSGWLRDGSLFETTELDNRPTLVNVNELVPGLSEGLERMVEGEHTRFWIPANLAYGEHPKKKAFPAGSLVYDVELIEIQKR